ncbi:iron-containing alcohol dehydrogenase [Pseudohoeflea coraliihabitans]|uniref:Iron-containing alcohol dehydrogenase n=1 Tax=Pseudohoeflea coraliihabitans TaxID=2860393 RepID=A0ABS6WMM2_9HYPH|nr:iron-containing alcohol dehydrogenase [Pseudohoeflea sp. DP4N28-3]MBW3097198.1 iron-containing alcohol dehydrogenase [Pseudohoeflea sp. DP4N28-3]
MFAFRTSINVKCGRGIVDELGDEVRELGYGRVLFVTDPGLAKTGISARGTDSLKRAGVEYEVFDSIEPNPRDSSMEAVWDSVKDECIEAVIGLGGGSAMDGAKAIAVLARNGGKLNAYDGPGKIKNGALPIVAIPTTAGTGSEVTSNAAITDAARHYKMSLRSPAIIPSLAILDPSLLASLPVKIAAESSMDAIIHGLESYTSNRANSLSEGLSIQSLEYLCPNIRPFVANRADPIAAEKMLIGSMFAGTVIGNTGTGNVHALARALGGIYDLPHGLACSMMFPYVVRFNFIAHPAKYRNFGRILGLPVDRCSDSTVCDLVVGELFRMCADLGIPTTFSEVGLDGIDVAAVSEVAIANSGPNPRTTTRADLESLLLEAK